MKQFFKFFTASCLGTFAAFALIFVVLAAYGGYMASKASSVATGSILELDFSKSIPEKSNNVSSGPYDFESEDFPGLRTIKRTLAHAATDKSIKGIVLRTKMTNMGQSTLLDLTNALEEFKESGKFIYSYEDYYTQSAYLLASTADSIFLNPNGLIDLKGFGTMIPFFKPMMDRLGVKLDIYYAGKFKSATEPFRRSDMSEPNKVQTRAFLKEMFEIYADKVSTNRNISKDKLNTVISNYQSNTAEGCLENKLVDQLIYHNEFTAFIKEKVGVKASKKLKTIDLEKYISKIQLKAGTSKNKIAVIFAEGNVTYDTNSKGEIDDKRYLKMFDKIKRKDDIKAVVLRVNSGGGSALTSDIIWNEIEELKADSIPVITSMGDYAASGGYYIACNSDKIVASPNTLTGSIGVFSMLPDVSEFLKNKIGVVFDTVKTHDLALANNMVYANNSREDVIMQKQTDAIYETFLNRVATGRNMSVEAVNEIAQGRVWTGKKAKEIGLVDELGDLDHAIAMAAEMADVENYKIIEYPTIKENPFKDIIKAFEESNASIKPAIFKTAKAKKMYQSAQELESLLQVEGPMARMPFMFSEY